MFPRGAGIVDLCPLPFRANVGADAHAGTEQRHQAQQSLMANQHGQASGCQQRQHKTHSTQHESVHGYRDCDWAGEAEQPRLCGHVVHRSEIHRVWRVRVTKHLMMSSSHPVVLTAVAQQFGTCGVFRVSSALRKGRAPKDTNPRR